jgi:hypothetical protein
MEANIWLGGIESKSDKRPMKSTKKVVRGIKKLQAALKLGM